MSVRRPGVLLAFVLLVLGGGFAVGFFTAPGAWYAALSKPSFTPPGWVFPVAWTVLYILIAIAGYRTFVDSAGSTAMKLWWGQLALNFLWPMIFFGAHRIGLALIVILSLLAVILAFMVAAWPRDRTSALLFLPYAVWVAFASVLNGSIFAAN